MARESRLFDLAYESDRLARARPNTGAHGISAACLYSICSCAWVGPLAVVAETALRGFLILCFPGLAGLSGVLYRVHPCACAWAPLFSRSRTGFVFARRMGSTPDADDA